MIKVTFFNILRGCHSIATVDAQGMFDEYVLQQEDREKFTLTWTPGHQTPSQSLRIASPGSCWCSHGRKR